MFYTVVGVYNCFSSLYHFFMTSRLFKEIEGNQQLTLTSTKNIPYIENTYKRKELHKKTLRLKQQRKDHKTFPTKNRTSADFEGSNKTR